MQRSAKKGVLETLQDAATTGNGTVLAISPGITKHTFIAKPSSGTISTGKLLFEAADDPAFAGTWIALGAEITLASGVEIRQSVDGILAFVRARISTNVTGSGGNVSAYYQGSSN